MMISGTYFGTILEAVPGADDWFNVKCDNEEQVLSLNLIQVVMHHMTIETPPLIIS